MPSGAQKKLSLDKPSSGDNAGICLGLFWGFVGLMLGLCWVVLVTSKGFGGMGHEHVSAASSWIFFSMLSTR